MKPEPASIEEELHWQPWQAAEREDFFAAITRHQRLAWRVRAACLLAYSVLAVVMSLLLAPLFYCLLGLLLDIVNLILPMPDLLAKAAVGLDMLLNRPADLSFQQFATYGCLALLPGMLILSFLGRRIIKAIQQSSLFKPELSPHRALNLTNFKELQFQHVVEEMAIAALIPVPKIWVIEGGLNAAVAGLNSEQAQLLVGEGVFKDLNRQQLQGLAAHLLVAIAEHDLKIGLQTSSVMGIFALISNIALNILDKKTWPQSKRLLFALFSNSQKSQQLILASLQDTLQNETHSNQPASDTDSGKLTWREWVLMPLMGPVFMSALLGQFVNSLFLIPLVGMVWRQRKYMADAGAVKLTREPNGLATTLVQTLGKSCALPVFSSLWANHWCIVKPEPLPSMIIGMFPKPEQRIKALIRLGADPLALPNEPTFLTLLK
ncbi:MAG TPA: hypothetical protein PLM98_09825, partial [Thiolinea sp.]|nr:hypothetical protein [Thiolinea sp.]